MTHVTNSYEVTAWLVVLSDSAVFKVRDVLTVTFNIIEHNAGVLSVVDFKLRKIFLQLFNGHRV